MYVFCLCAVCLTTALKPHNLHKCHYLLVSLSSKRLPCRHAIYFTSMALFFLTLCPFFFQILLFPHFSLFFFLYYCRFFIPFQFSVNFNCLFICQLCVCVCFLLYVNMSFCFVSF